MGVMQWLGLRESAAPAAPATAPGALETATHQVEVLQESLGRLELAMEDMGWEQITAQYKGEFSRDGLARAAELCRLMAVANPLVKRGLAVRAAYVHGQGVGVSAPANGDGGTLDVNAVVQDFLDDDGNRATVTGHQAKLSLETALGTDGNVFIALFTKPLTGEVQARTLPFDEVTDKVTKPGDRAVTYYYLRQWVEDGQQMSAYYPDLRYRPITRQKRRDGIPIMWDSPVYHLRDNGLDGWLWGIGDAYAALPWARAYKEFLEDWTLLTKSLSKIAYQTTSKSASQQKRAQLAQMGQAPAGSSVSMSDGQKIEAVPKSGATIDADSGRPVLAMVAAALGLPVTTLSADPGQTGARAVAETLNLPTRLEFQNRQELWTEAYRAILGYVIDQAVIAPRGPLKGTVERDTDTLTVTLAKGTERTLEIVWPDIDELPVDVALKAIADADSLDAIPKPVLVKPALRALGVRDVDEVIDQITDDNGDFIDPNTSAGDAAVRAFRAGQDPAAAVK